MLEKVTSFGFSWIEIEHQCVANDNNMHAGNVPEIKIDWVSHLSGGYLQCAKKVTS